MPPVKKTLSPTVSESLQGQTNVVVHSAIEVVKNNPIKLPFISLASGLHSGAEILRRSAGQSVFRSEIYGETVDRFNSFELWELYKDPSIQTAIGVRNNSLFGGGWKAEFEGEEDQAKGGPRTIQASREVHDYMNKVMTPFARDLVRHLDCFGLAPVRITYNNGVPTPTIPVLGTYEVEMWINKEGQTKYTFIPDDNDEDDSESDENDDDLYTDNVGQQVKLTYDVRRAKKDVTAEHVTAARLALHKKGKEDVFLNAHELRMPYGRQHGTKTDAWSEHAVAFAKLYKRWRDGIVTVRTLDISETVFFIVLDKPDYHTGQFTSKMCTLAPLIMEERQRNRCLRRVVDLQTRRDIYYEDNKTMNKVSSASLSNAAVDAENAIGRGTGDETTVTGFQMNTQVFYSSTSKDQGNELTVAQRAYQDEATIKYKMLEGFASKTAADGNGGERPTVVFKNPDGYVTPGFQIANMPQTEAKIDYSQMHEQYVMAVSSLLAVPSSSFRQNTSSKGMGGGSTSSGMSDMHLQTSETNLDSWTQIIGDYVLTIMRMIFIGEDETVTHALNLPDFNVPEDEIFVKSGKHSIRPMVAGAGGLNASGKFNDYERFVGTATNVHALMCATDVQAETDNESEKVKKHSTDNDAPEKEEEIENVNPLSNDQFQSDSMETEEQMEEKHVQEQDAEKEKEKDMVEEEEEEIEETQQKDEPNPVELVQETQTIDEPEHSETEHVIVEKDSDEDKDEVQPDNVEHQVIDPVLHQVTDPVSVEHVDETEKVEEKEEEDVEEDEQEGEHENDTDDVVTEAVMFSEYRRQENETIRKIKLEYRLKKMKRLRISLNRISNKPPDDILSLRDNGVLDPHEANNILLRRYNIHATHANVKYAESMKRNWRYPEEESDTLQHKKKK